MRCACGHLKTQHIYEEGACRPGFICAFRCEQFRPPNTRLSGVSRVAHIGKLGLYVMKNRNEPRTEISVESMATLFDWHINIFGWSHTVWLEFD